MVPVARDVLILCAAFCTLTQLPRAALYALQLATTPLIALAFLRRRSTPLARANYLRRSTGSVDGLLRRWARSAGRVVTTTVQLGADPAVLLTHLLGVTGCSAMLAQGWWFRRATEKALITAPLPVPPDPLSVQMRVRSAILEARLGVSDSTRPSWSG